MGGSGGPNMAEIEDRRRREAEAASRAAREESFSSELDRLRRQRGRASTILTQGIRSSKQELG